MMKRTIAISLFAIGAWGQSQPGPRKLAPELANSDANSTVDVIVQFNAPPTEQYHQKVTKKGGTLKSTLDVVKAGHYSLPASALAALASDPDVTYISPDREVHGMLDYANPTIGANLAFQSGLDGTGVGIAVIDSGIIPVNDLYQTARNGGKYSRIVYSQNFVPV